MKRTLTVVGEVVFHVIAMNLAFRFLDVKPRDYMLWVIFVKVAMLEYDIRTKLKIKDDGE